jgi:hypothetical protein
MKHHISVSFGDEGRSGHAVAALGFSSMAGRTGVVVALDGEILAPDTPLLYADDILS